MRIRPFELEDYPASAELWQAADGMTAPALEEVERKLGRDPELFLVADDEAEHPAIVGVVIGSYDGRRGWIFRLAVDPRHRRRGVGRALVEELERRYETMGVRRIRLLTTADNEPARRFWEQLGYGAYEEVVLFSKDLGP